MKSFCFGILAFALCTSSATVLAQNKTDFNHKLDILLTKLAEAKAAPKDIIADIDIKKTELTNRLEWAAQNKLMAFKNATADEATKVMHAFDKQD